jgi:hypothetical protein
VKNEEAIPLIISVDEPEHDPQAPFLREEPITKEIPAIPISKIPKKILPEVNPLELEINSVPESLVAKFNDQKIRVNRGIYRIMNPH